MRKKFLVFFSIFFILGVFMVAEAKSYKTPELAKAIKLYKSANYSECYLLLEKIIQQDSSNPLAYYYMAITSAQIGRTSDAIDNYNKVLLLSPGNNNLYRYATKGKLCLESPEQCSDSYYENELEEFIQKKQNNNFTKEVQADYEKLKLENFMREMNRKDSVENQRFNDFKDFSSEKPSNDEVIKALNILQQAGFSNLLGFNNQVNQFGLSNGTQYNSMFDIMNNSSMNTQLIQALLTNGITQGF